MISRWICVALAAAVGCASVPLRVPTPEPVPHDTARRRDISQRACGFMLGGAIPIGMSDRYRRGYEGLVAQAPGEYVTDVRVQEALTYAFVGWRYCARFAATAFPKGVR